MATILYPDQIDNSSSIPVAIDLVSPVKSAFVNTLRDGLLAVQATLGLRPMGTYGTVRSRLDALEDGLNGVIAGGGGSGGSGGGGGSNRVSAYGSLRTTTSSALILSGVNIGTITRTGIGKATITFITPLITNYSIAYGSDNSGGSVTTTSKTSTHFTIERADSSGSARDGDFSVIVCSEDSVASSAPSTLPVATTPVVAWGHIRLDGYSATIISSLNIDTVTRTSTGSVNVTFVEPVLTAYAIVPSVNTDGGQVAATTQSSSGFTIERADSAGLQLDANFSFVVLSQGVVNSSGGGGGGGGGTTIITTGPAAWANITLTSGGAVLASGFNIQSVSRTAIGSVTITFTNPITGGYSSLLSNLIDGGEATTTSQSTTQVTIERADSTGVAADLNFTFSALSNSGGSSGGGGGGGSTTTPQTAYAWGYVVLTAGGATLSSSFNCSGVTRNDVGQVTVTMTTTPASSPNVVVGTPSVVAGTVVESSQVGNQIVIERGNVFGVAQDANFSFIVYSNG